MWRLPDLHPEQSFRCYTRACNLALQAATGSGRAVKVVYVGPHRQGNTDPATGDFLVLPDGSRDQTIDPTWWTNGRR